MPSSAHAARIVGCGSPPCSFCGRGGQRDRADAGDLGGHDVHHHAGDQRREAAGHVEADPVDRHHAVGHPGARRRASVTTSCSSSASQVARSRRIDSSSPARTSGSRSLERVLECRAAARRCRSAVDAVEPLRRTRGSPRRPRSRTASQIGMDRRDRGLDVEVRARHGGAVVDGARRLPRRSMRRIMGSILVWRPRRRSRRRLPWDGSARGLEFAERERHAADVPAERGAVPRRQRAAARCSRTATARWCTTCCGSPDPADRLFGSVGDPRGLRGRRPRRPVAVPGRLPGPADRGRVARRRHLRHRRGRAGPDPARAAGHHRRLPGRARRGPPRAAGAGRRSEVVERARATFAAYRVAARRRSAPTRTPATCRATRRTCPGRWPRVAPLPLHERQALLEAEDAALRLVMVTDLLRDRAARDERDPVAARDRGGPHPLVAQLTDPDGAEEDGRRHAGHGGADPGRDRVHAARVHPRPARDVVRAGGGRGAGPRPGAGLQDADGPVDGALVVGSCRCRASSTSRRWPARSAAAGGDGRPGGRRARDRVRRRRHLADRPEARATRTVVDESALEPPTVFVSAGRRGLDLEIAPGRPGPDHRGDRRTAVGRVALSD